MVSVNSLCMHTARMGHDVRVLTTNANGHNSVLRIRTDKEIVLSEHCTARYCRRIFPEAVSPQLLSLLLSYVRKADVVHLTAVYSFTTLPTLLACRVLNKPLIWSPRGALMNWTGSRRRLFKYFWNVVCRLILPNRTVLHATSKEEARAFLDPFPKCRSVTVPNGVELPSRVRLARPAGLHRLLYIGRLHEKKGVEELIDAIATLELREKYDCVLTIAGSGDPVYEKYLKSMVESRKLSKRIRFVGFVTGNRKEDLLRWADAVIVPSHTENFGIVIAESLARGIPVIASRGTPWAGLETHRCGLWVENDAASLANAIATMARKPLQKMGQRGRKWMQRNYSWEDVAEQIVKTYSNLLAQAAI